MTRAYVPLLTALAALWGASYMFIKVAVEEIAPTTMMAVRLLVAASVLLAFLAAQRGLREVVAGLRGAGPAALALES